MHPGKATDAMDTGGSIGILRILVKRSPRKVVRRLMHAQGLRVPKGMIRKYNSYKEGAYSCCGESC